MNKYKLNSGKMVEMNLAPIEPALKLYQAVLFECKNAGLDLKPKEDESVTDLILKNTGAILTLASSSLVLEAIKGCCEKVLYDKQRFSMELFEDEKARADFFPLMILVAGETLRPFFPYLDTVFTVILSQVLKTSDIPE